MTSFNQSDDSLFPSLPNIKFQMADAIGGTYSIGTLEKDQAEFWENKAEKDLTNSIEDYVRSEDKDAYIKENNIPERNQNIRCNDYESPEYFKPDYTTDFDNICQIYGPVLELSLIHI